MTSYIPSPTGWVAEQVKRIEESGGTDGTALRGMPVVLVTMQGRKTGAVRKVPLMRVKAGDHYALIGSKGGAPENPVWVYNLRANPDVTLRDGTEVMELRAREVADDAERAPLWTAAVAAFPDYANYQERTERKIPVFVLEPR
jgi:deazaflavin-dependent oxidoreductase (nitroreductase family)